MEKTRWPLAQAEEVAQELLAMLTAFCEVIQVAGSVRRRKPDVGDVELLCVPLRSLDLFSEPSGDLLAPQLLDLIRSRVLDYRLDNRGRRSFGPLNKNLIHVPSGIAVDVFTGSLENWGRDLLIRTGSAAFNVRVMSRFQQLGLSGHAYGPSAVTGASVGRRTAPQEEDMFRLLQWDFIQPEARV